MYYGFFLSWSIALLCFALRCYALHSQIILCLSSSQSESLREFLKRWRWQENRGGVDSNTSSSGSEGGRKTSEFNFTSETFHSLAFVLPSHRLLMLKVGFFGLGILFLWLKYFIIFASFSSIVRKSVCVCGTRVVFNLNINLYMFTEYIHCKSNEYKLVMKIRALNAALNCKNANHQLQ